MFGILVLVQLLLFVVVSNSVKSLYIQVYVYLFAKEKCWTVASKYHVHFWTDTLGKCIEPSYLPVMC